MFDFWGSLGPEPDTKDPWYGFHKFKRGCGGNLTEFVGTWDLVLNPIIYTIYSIGDKLRWLLLRSFRLDPCHSGRRAGIYINICIDSSFRWNDTKMFTKYKNLLKTCLVLLFAASVGWRYFYGGSGGAVKQSGGEAEITVTPVQTAEAVNATGEFAIVKQVIDGDGGIGKRGKG